MSRQQKRFTKRFEIEMEINKLNQRAKSKLAASEDLDRSAHADLLRANASDAKSWEREFFKNTAVEKLRKSRLLKSRCLTIEAVLIPQLGRTLAAFQTETLFPGDDKSVVLQQ